MLNFFLKILSPIIILVAFLQFNIAGNALSAENNFILIWSSNSYAPLNYEGKTLPTKGSEIKVYVLPTKKLSPDPENLYYRWLLDDEIMGCANDQGKSVFKFTASKWAGDSHEIELQILDGQDGNIIWRGYLKIKVVSPEVLLQTPDSNYAVKDTFSTKTGRDITFIAVPLFFHIKNLSEVYFEWKFADQKLASVDEKNLNQLKLKIPAGDLSESLLKNLSVLIKHKEDSTQQKTLNLNVEIK